MTDMKGVSYFTDATAAKKEYPAEVLDERHPARKASLRKPAVEDAVPPAEGKQLVAYVSGPYRDARGVWWVEQNIRAAEAVAVALWGMGFAAICPHTNTKHMDGAFPASDDVFLNGDLAIVRKCDLVVMVGHWSRSAGALKELAEADRHGIPAFRWSDHQSMLSGLAQGQWSLTGGIDHPF